MTSTISLDGMRSLNNVLQRLPDGEQALALVRRMGLWSPRVHDPSDGRVRTFPTNYSALQGTRLSDECAYWQSEAFRATELCGLLEGQRVKLVTEGKSLRAATRAKLRRKHREDAAAAGQDAKVKDPSATQLNDEVEESADVQQLDATVGMLLVVLESAKAYKEACLNGCASLSREISLRQAMMNARL